MARNPIGQAVALTGAMLFGFVPFTGGAKAAGVRSTVESYESAGNEVTVECFAPNDRVRHPVILMLHGSGGLEQATGPIFRGAATNLARKGYVVLIPHFFEGGDDHPARLAAVRNCVEFAASRRDVDPDRVGLFGLSMGAYLSFAHSVKDPRVKAVASCSGSLPIGSKSKFPPTIILHGSNDESTPLRIALGFVESLKANDTPCTVHVYKGAGHNFDAARFHDAARRVGAFFDLHVKKQNPTEPPSKTPDGRPVEAPRVQKEPRKK